MSNIDEQFVEYIVKSLVSNPEGVTIDRTIDEKGVLLKLTVDQEDLGRVIGKRGATAQSIRTLLRALGTKNDARYNLKIVDTGESSPKSDVAAPAAEDEPAASAPTADDTTASDTTPDDVPDDESSDDSVEAVETEPQEPVEEEESLAERTRKELDDLDDLEI